MERLRKIIEGLTEDAILNTAREYLQVLVLKSIYQSKFGKALSFMGGTCLRICYDLKRYSEDLDFCLDQKTTSYSFASMVEQIERELRWRGFDLSTNVHEEKTVQKAFLRIQKLGERLGLRAWRRDQKLHIKLEVDTHPPPLHKEERESLFVNRHQEIFPILKHTLTTLFAGKILAIFLRPYNRGRDYYDLIWYLTRKTPLNLGYLNRGLSKRKFQTEEEAMATLQDKVSKLDPRLILKDIGHFLEDPKEREWILRYPQLFQQLTLK